MGNEKSGFRFDVVMLIDDDETDNYINKRVIANSSFSKNIIAMTNAEDALQYLVRNSETVTLAKSLPLIIFLDLNMSGMSGIEFLNRFHLLNPAAHAMCSIVVLSNFIHQNDAKELRSNPYVTHFMEKPLTVEKLESLKF